ncbi:MAG: tetratricopeptide repeat protein [bacterium]
MKRQLIQRMLNKLGVPKNMKFADIQEMGYYLRLKLCSCKAEILELIGDWSSAKKIYYHNLKSAEKVKNEQFVAECKDKIGMLLLKQGDYQKSLAYLRAVHRIYSRFGNRPKIGNALHNLGVIYLYRGDYDKALQCFTQELTIFTRLRDQKGICRAVTKIGTVHYYWGEFAQALRAYQKSMKIAQSLNDQAAIGGNLLNMGTIYYYQGNYHGALKCYTQDLRISQKIGDKQGTGITLGNLGMVYFSIGNYDKSLEFYLKDLSISEELHDKLGIANALGNIGIVYSEKGDFSRAFECYKMKLMICRGMGNKDETASALGYIGDLYKMQGSFAKAQKFYDQAIKIGRKLKKYYFLCEWLHNQAEVCYHLRKPTTARKLNHEALLIAGKMKSDNVIFLGRLLHAKILLSKNKERGLRELNGLLKEYAGDNERSLLHYELFKITNAQTHRKTALTLFRRLYRKTPSNQFKEKIIELKK